MFKLTRFVVNEGCALSQSEIERIKAEIAYYVKTIDEGLKEGRDYYFCSYLDGYKNQLAGIRLTCAMIGISVRTEYKEEPETCSEN
ncbi:hypothetical protein [Bacillus mesophilum]|uniref:Uncharacterized protein n=1 Tax=Bacillus mesophilum TaxID=1071718 RepID=A0A7V7RM10_9BACI|nr:hypothetical protein [Bacillus mesophilum]KAB2332922.1 hypothetical protein F7732_12640 [Bacillus mesophilum]